MLSMKKNTVIVLWLSTLLVGCSVSTPLFGETPGVVSETFELPTLIHTAAATTGNSTFSPDPKDVDEKPTEAILTPRKTSIPTQTKKLSSPTATLYLLLEVTKDAVRKMIFENGSCQLPCVWGQTPGQTSTHAFKKFAEQFEVFDEEGDIWSLYHYYDRYGGFDIFLEHTENTGDLITNSFGLSYWDNDNIVEALSLSANVQIRNEQVAKTAYGHPSFREHFGYYFPSQILSNYGKPSQVWILPFMRESEMPSEYRPAFNIVLAYLKQGFFVEYIQPRSETEDLILGCPKDAGDMILVSWDPNRQLLLPEVVNLYHSGPSAGGFNNLTIDHFRPIEEVTSMTLDEFYLHFKNPENESCIETPKELWP